MGVNIFGWGGGGGGFKSIYSDMQILPSNATNPSPSHQIAVSGASGICTDFKAIDKKKSIALFYDVF